MSEVRRIETSAEKRCAVHGSQNYLSPPRSFEFALGLVTKRRIFAAALHKLGPSSAFFNAVDVVFCTESVEVLPLSGYF